MKLAILVAALVFCYSTGFSQWGQVHKHCSYFTVHQPRCVFALQICRKMWEEVRCLQNHRRTHVGIKSIGFRTQFHHCTIKKQTGHKVRENNRKLYSQLFPFVVCTSRSKLYCWDDLGVKNCMCPDCIMRPRCQMWIIGLCVLWLKVFWNHPPFFPLIHTSQTQTKA